MQSSNHEGNTNRMHSQQSGPFFTKKGIGIRLVTGKRREPVAPLQLLNNRFTASSLDSSAFGDQKSFERFYLGIQKLSCHAIS
jgi:hypothetical protein